MAKALNEKEWAATVPMDQLKQRLPDIRDAFFWDLYEKWRGETLIPAGRLYASYQAFCTVLANDVPGAIVECGVFRGGSFCFFMDVAAALSKRPREFWAYDTFEGFPEEVDEALVTGQKFGRDDWHTTDFRFLFDRNVARTSQQQAVRVVQGSVLETLPANRPDQIAFLHLDTDYYEATRHEFTHLYPLVVDGAPVVIDDYGYFEGSRRAVDEFVGQMPVKPMLIRTDSIGRIMFKV